MKKLLLIFIVLFFFTKSKAQVVFCPPGAEWHFLFSGSIFSPGNTNNEPILYVGDSIQGLDTLKILMHNRFFMTCGPYTHATLIKQKGDTIFFKNSFSQNTWQILYNFAAQPNQSWQTTVLINYGSLTKTFSFSVQAVGTVTLNGLSLKQMTVSTSDWGASGVITERIGSSAFLFHFSSVRPSKCEGDIFIESLCYKDNSFGVKQFSEKSCYYSTSNGVGLSDEPNEKLEIKIYPNPVLDFLTIETSSTEVSQISIVDVFGKEVKRLECKNANQIMLSDLRSGIYLVMIKQNERVISNTKIIKE